MNNLDSRPDPSWTEVQKGNQHAGVMWNLLESKFPRTHRLLAGSRYQLPPKRQADYPNHEYAAHFDAQALLDGLAAHRLSLLGDSKRWKSVGGPFIVTNEWLKTGQRTLFVERELGEALKRTDLPEGFGPQDLRWRWNAFRLVLPAGLFGGHERLFGDEELPGAWDVPFITVMKVNQGQAFEFHPDLYREVQTAFLIKTAGKKIEAVALSDDANEDGMCFCLQRRGHPDQKWGAPLNGGCKLNQQTLQALANEAPYSSGGGLYPWDRGGDKYIIEVKRFLFNVLLFLGSLPEEYEPDQVLRPGREKKGRFRPELRAARFLGKEAYRPARRPEGKADHEPTGRKLLAHWKAGCWKRVAHGPGMSLRRLQWIQPYRTHGPDAGEDLT
jgi:hypothetical protein